MASLAFKVIGAIGLASYAAAYVCAKLRHVSYHRFRIVAVPAAGLPSLPRGYSWRVLEPGEIAALKMDVGPEVQAERLASGLSCLAVFDRSGALAGVSWLGRETYREFGVSYVLPARTAWDTGLWVPEDKRMGRAFAAVWAAIGEWLRAEGLAWTMSSIADYNIPSILSHRRLGAHELRWFVVLRLGSLQLTYGARPFLYLSRRASAPTARLRLPEQLAAAA